MKHRPCKKNGVVISGATMSLVLLSLVLGACSSPAPRRSVVVPEKRTVPEPVRFKASFDCSQSGSPLQDVICADNALSALDRDMADAYRANLRSLDFAGRMQLIADQRYWLLARATQCRLPKTRLGSAKPNAGQVNCLGERYRQRIATLKAWPQPQARKVAGASGGEKFHPLGAYVEYRLAAGSDPLCGQLTKQFNDAIGAHGAVNFTRMNGFTQVAGTHGVASAGRYKISLYDAGPYASYQWRAIGLDIDGQTVIHDRSIGEWVAQLPNSGGRFGNTSSQTRDYASIDVFKYQQRTLALVNEAWGYYSAAANGESAYAGVYDVSSGAQPVCLWTTYLTPPIARAFDSLTAYQALSASLRQMTGEPPLLEMDERRDESLLQKETEWTLLNLPLVAIGEIERFGRQAALRQRHDAALEAIWNWSERNVPSKLLYRRVLPMMQPAHEELVRYFQQSQGLKPDEARQAADLMIMDLIDRNAENLADFKTAKAQPLAPFANYTPRYAPAPMPGDLERGRKLSTLHSAALNRSPAATIADFIKYEGKASNGKGAAGDTALMAAVRTPGMVQQLLDAGFDVNASNDWKKTALMTAAQTNQLESAQILLAAGANVQGSTSCWHADGGGALDNDEGAVAKRTPLMYAASGAGEPLLRLLLERGANVAARDAAGNAACQYLTFNTVLTDAERSAIKPLLCTAETSAATVVAAAQCSASSTPTYTAEEMRQLGGAALTAHGAERAGNDDGTIPEYTGNGVRAPTTWKATNPGVRPDPYGEKPVFTITAQNADKYADKLDAMMDVFRKYPDFRMDIYPSHRDFVFPQYVLDNTAKNVASCKAKNDESKLEGCYGGVPFPIPETGKQAMWNHLTAYTSRASSGRSANYIVPSAGSPVLVGITRGIQDFPYYDTASNGPRASSGIFWRALFTLDEPARWTGTQMMLLNPLDQVGIGSRTYFSAKGLLGRAKMMPSLAYDTPVPWSGDTQTMDDIRVFNGAMGKYDFKLIGKKEKYIAYNAFKMTDPQACPPAVFLTRNFPNPDCVRWELHRVWVVEATLKPGASHLYRKRIFYWDEDGFIAGQAENYSGDGRVHRIVVGATYPYFEAPGGSDSATFSLDLKTGMWSAQAVACPNCGDSPLTPPPEDKLFSPDGMAAAAR